MQTVKFGTLEYEAAPNIAVPHGFTTRLGGVSSGYLSSLNLGMHRGDCPENVEKNYEILGNAIGFDPKKTVFCHQVHSDTVLAVTEENCLGLDHHLYPESDGLITDTPGLALAVFTADCTPILLHDPVRGAVGAVHAGWRGTAADIAGKTVRAMEAHFGCRPENIRAAIGPNIGFCCFETDGEVPQAMEAAFGSEALTHIRPAGRKFYVNLKAMNALALRRTGVQDIEICAACTRCQSDRYWSHRATGGRRGSQTAVILCGEVNP